MKKATIKPTTVEKILSTHGISKKRQAAVLARYRAALKAPSKGSKTSKRRQERETVTA